MNHCDHDWIGDTCANCGTTWSAWAEQTLSKLRALVLVLERENRRLEREVLTLRQLRAAEVDA